MASRNDWEGRFNHKTMQEIMAYLLTYNCESQVFAVDGSHAENVQTTGTKMVMLNGTPTYLAADAEYDISAEAAYADWAVSTSYTTGGTASEVVQDGRHFVCILAHTSYGYLHTHASYVEASSNQPLHGALWRTYWRELDVWAQDAAGDSLLDTYVGWYLACALADGTLRLFKAYDSTASTYGTATPVRIPCYDPTRYVAVGLLKITCSTTFVLGTTSTATVSVFYQLIGPVLPDANLIDKN